jgi:ATP-dependent Clp protease ATP-binding subunit ClpC
MDFFILILIVGAAAAIYLAVRHSARQAQTPAAVPGPAVADTVAPAQRLQALSEPLNAVGEASAHPRDVAENPKFLEAAQIFEVAGLDVVTDYVTGFNWMLAAAACAGLAWRADRQAPVATVLAAFHHLRPWPIFYALRYFDALDSPPPVGALVLQCPEWWSEHPLIPALLAEHFAARRTRGEMPAFGDGLSSVTPSQLPLVEALLRRIDHTSARELLEALKAHRRVTLDRDYLQAFGRFVQDDPSRALLVAHDLVKEELSRAESSSLQPPHRSLVVVGEPRSGKSSFLTLLAMRAEALGWTMFEAGGPQLQAGQTYIGQLEERLQRLAAELAVEKRVLWHVPDFLQLVSSGTHKGQSASILDQILPAIASGRVVVLSEITPTALTKVLQQRPALRTALELVRLRPLGDQETHRLAAAVAARIASTGAIHVEPEVIETSTHLARHYLGASQMPGAVLDLLKLSAQRAAARDEPRLTRDDVLATMSQLSGMPVQVLDDRERVDLGVLRAFFSARVIGQDEAVEAVVGRVAMLKAGLTDPGKPVGVFLFAGPTGTGKTELAKTLAEFLFGSAERLIRLDMSEFQSADAMRKIVGDPGNTEETHALTDRVRKQPFSVVLLDEFEKAHPNTWDLFLQVFDDGRLTDANGQTVDFRHCIIILTSNLGSTIKQDAAPGFLAHGQTVSAERVRKAINQSFRPEFVNRLDRIIVFRSLDRGDMRRIVAKELSRVLERRGLRHREWAVEWEASALEFLLDSGFSPAMGARPLKRAIDEHLLAPLAATLVEHRYPEGDQFLFVRSDGRALQVEFVDPDAPADSAPRSDAEPAGPGTVSMPRMMVMPAGSAAEAAALAADLRRVEEDLAGEPWLAIVTELAARMQRPDFWHQPDRQSILSRFEVMDRVKAAAATAAGLSARLGRSTSASGRYSRDLVGRLASQLFVVRHGIEDVLTDEPVEIVLAVQAVMDRDASAAASARWCERLLDMYRAWSARRGMRVAEVTTGSVARCFLVISGFGASRLLSGEAGLHVMDYEDAAGSGRAVARVIVTSTPPTLPSSLDDQHAALAAAVEKASVPPAVVRRYRLDSSPVVRDLRQGWRTGRVDLVFGGHFDLMGDLSSAGDRE